jgi:hypothetical protein
VRDALTQAPLPQAQVLLRERAVGALAGDEGQFAFAGLAPGRYRVEVRALGYHPEVREVEVGPGGVHREAFALARAVARALPVVVNGVQPGATTAALGGTTLTADALAPLVRGPGLVVPGAPTLLGLSRRDGIGDLHLQGGEAGEHLWRLDGAPVFDAAGLAGLFGHFAPLALGELRVRRAGFGARTGSFTAGVLDLAHDVGGGRSMTPGAAVQFDPLAATVRVDLPVTGRGRTLHTMLAAREGLWPWYAPGALSRTLTQWNAPDAVLMQRLLSPGTHDSLGARRYGVDAGMIDVALRDVHLATRLDLGAFRSLDASWYEGRHGVGAMTSASARGNLTMAGRDDYAWDTRVGQLRHRWVPTARLTHVAQLSFSEHGLTHRMALAPDLRGLAAAAPAHEGNRIREVTALTTLGVTGSDRWEGEVGLALTQATARLDLANGVARPLAAAVGHWRGVLHADAAWRIGARRWLDLGVRFTQLDGVARPFVEPRLALRAEGTHDRLGQWAWRVGTGLYHQFATQFDVATTMPVALVPSVRFWLPVVERRGVPTAVHAGSELVLQPRPGWELRAEGYAKWQPTILAFDYGRLLDDVGAPPGDPLAFIGRARGRALGVGLRAIRDGWQLAGRPTRLEVGYDAGDARRTFPSRFDGTLQPAPWNEPHRLLAAIELRPTAGLVVGTRVRGVWGRPWALRQAYYDLLTVHSAGAGLPIAPPGTARRPALLEADLGASWTRSIGLWRAEVGLAVQNLFDRRNVLDFALERDAASPRYDWRARTLPPRQLLLSMRLAR